MVEKEGLWTEVAGRFWPPSCLRGGKAPPEEEVFPPALGVSVVDNAFYLVESLALRLRCGARRGVRVR